MLFVHLQWLWLLRYFVKMLKQFKFLLFLSIFHCDILRKFQQINHIGICRISAPMKQKIQHQITPHPLWETIKVEKFHYITNHISKWIEIYSEVAFLFLYAPTLPLHIF